MKFLQPQVKPHCWSIGKSGYARSFHQISPEHHMHVLELSGGQSQSKYHARASRWPSKQIKLPMYQPKACRLYIESHNDPVLSSLMANYACPPVVCDHCTLRSSEQEVPTSSAPLLTNQHENADVSFIDLRSYIPEISWVRSSILPPLLRGGD